MEWRGRRESSNVEDRRGMKTTGALGGGALVIAILYTLFTGDPTPVINEVQNRVQNRGQPAVQFDENDEGSQFMRVVLADTEDVWRKVFQASGHTYVDPKLVLFTDRVQSACGTAGSSVGPFYCPADQKLYLDLGFFQEMSGKLGAKGDFAQAYVVAHEVGHHVQNLLGLSGRMQEQRGRMSEKEANRESVKIELQADCLAGIWAHDTNQMNQSLQPGDVEEAMNAASAVGDDKLQKASRGYAVPDSFTHGSSAQRVASFSQGFKSGNLASCDIGPQILDATR